VLLFVAHQAIYRKWRPLVFEDVIGQTHITQTLKNQIINNKISHAYLFCGTRGTGKTSAAKILARAVNCLNSQNGSPCNECEICRGILNGNILDVLEIDAASNNGVDNIRDIKDEIAYPPSVAKYRVYIIDEVHMLSPSAFNALLKTLEEPPEHSVFILATTEPHKVPVTILSRCQRFDFKRIKSSDIMIRMKQIAFEDHYDITDDAISLLADLADGSMRDGLSIMERCISSVQDMLTSDKIVSVLGISSKSAVFSITDAIIEKNTKSVFEIINTSLSEGKDINVFISDIINHLRSLLVCKVSADAGQLDTMSEKDLVVVKAQAEKISFERLSFASELLSDAMANAKWVKSPRIIYEMAFVKLCRPEFDNSQSALLTRLSDMEEKIKNGIKIDAEPKETKKPETKPKPKKKVLPSKRVFSPIPDSLLNSSHPFVGYAKNWDKVIKEITKNFPHLIGPIRDKSITIDSDGIVIIYEKKDFFSKNLADSVIGDIEKVAAKVFDDDIRIKTANKEEIEDFIVDFWALPEPSADEVSVGIQSENDKKKDPVDALAEKFPEIVEFTDESEFLNFVPTDTEQAVLDF